MRHLGRITVARADSYVYSDEEVLSILDRIFSFALQVIRAKGKSATAVS